MECMIWVWVAALYIYITGTCMDTQISLQYWIVIIGVMCKGMTEISVCLINLYNDNIDFQLSDDLLFCNLKQFRKSFPLHKWFVIIVHNIYLENHLVFLWWFTVATDVNAYVLYQGPKSISLIISHAYTAYLRLCHIHWIGITWDPEAFGSLLKYLLQWQCCCASASTVGSYFSITLIRKW